MQEQEKKVAVEETVDTEYMLEPVPMNKRRSTYSQIMVWVGFGYCATGLFVGGTLAGYGGAPGLNPVEALHVVNACMKKVIFLCMK